MSAVKRGPEPLTSLSTKPTWVTIAEGAAHVRVSRRSMYRLIKNHDLEVFEITPRRRLIRLADLEALVRPKRRATLPAEFERQIATVSRKVRAV